ncbi:MAG: tetratricopeptide repeat protein, partial [Planctomycetota bacterium]
TNVRVLTHAGPSRTGTFTVADAYCRDGLYEKAVEKYRQIATAHVNQPIALLAQCKVALAMMADQRWSEAEAQLRGLAEPCKGTDLEHLMALWHGRSLGMMGKSDEALRVFKRVQEATSDPGIIDETAVACGLLSEALRRDERWLESGRFAKFLFENLTTPLIETSHMFGRYGNRLHEARLFEEEYQAVTKVGVAVAEASTDPSHFISAQLRRVRTAVLTDRFDVGEQVLADLETRARESGDAGLELSVIGNRAAIELSQGKYQAALERVSAFAGTEEEEESLKEAAWGNTLADLRACACTMLGRVAEALDDLDAGRISRSCMDLRMSLAAELWRRGNQSAAGNCLAVLQQAAPPRTGKLLRMATSALRGEALVEPLEEYVETSLQPVHQPRGLFYAGLALWAAGNDGAATMPWSDAKNSTLEVAPVWHWVNYFQSRIET